MKQYTPKEAVEIARKYYLQEDVTIAMKHFGKTPNEALEELCILPKEDEEGESVKE